MILLLKNLKKQIYNLDTMYKENEIEKIHNISYKKEDYFIPTIDDLKVGSYYYWLNYVENTSKNQYHRTHGSIKYIVTEKCLKTISDWLGEENQWDFFYDNKPGVQWRLRMKCKENE